MSTSYQKPKNLIYAIAYKQKFGSYPENLRIYSKREDDPCKNYYQFQYSQLLVLKQCEKYRWWKFA